MKDLSCFVAIEFTNDPNVAGWTYWYYCPFKDAVVGDKAVAPLGRHNREQTGVIRKIKFAHDGAAPFPIQNITVTLH